MEYRPDVAMDWAYAHQLSDGEAWLVPPTWRSTATSTSTGWTATGPPTPRPGNGPLLRRVVERLCPWLQPRGGGAARPHGADRAGLVPHGVVPPGAAARHHHRSIDDATSTMLLDGIEARGFDVHLLATTYDLGLPAVWALAVNRVPDAVPATFSAAGSSPVPGDAVRAALWELAQLVARPVDWDVDAVRPLVEDPSLVDTIEDHVQLYAMPERRDRVAEVLGGPATTLEEAFPGWPAELCQAAQGDVRGALDFLVGRCRAAGLDRVLVVDQSTREHLDLGLRVARVVVPGMLPMCFGSPQQRLGGLPRRRQALRALGRADEAQEADLLLDPHPFP